MAIVYKREAVLVPQSHDHVEPYWQANDLDGVANLQLVHDSPNRVQDTRCFRHSQTTRVYRVLGGKMYVKFKDAGVENGYSRFR